jgi:nucleoside-diphosphate-sugar epimerase
MRILLTGVAGFIGSHLAEAFLERGFEVVGVDCLTDFYDVRLKRANLESLVGRSGFRFVEADLCTCDLDALLDGASIVSHHAAQAGVRTSWGSQFVEYTRRNVDATQRLLEAVREKPLEKFIYASSSSVYGRAENGLMDEELRPQPVSPYGVTKLAAENLVQLYHWSYGVPTVSLRYFTVFGPRQRPDMAFHRFIRAALLGQPLSVFGDGGQSRDFTFVEDVVQANLAAMDSDAAGAILNIGGGARVDLHGVLATLERILGRPVARTHGGPMRGDMRHTAADISRARRLIGYEPKWNLERGLERQVAWGRQLLERETANES